MSRDCDRTMGPESITCGAAEVLANDRFAASIEKHSAAALAASQTESSCGQSSTRWSRARARFKAALEITEHT